MQASDITKHSTNSDRKRIGRGGKRGKTSGRGHKGQNARAGTSGRPEHRDLIKKFPKLRGQGKHGNKPRPIITYFAPVNVASLEEHFDAKAEITPDVLVSKGLVSKRLGKTPRVKILGNGDLKKSFAITGCEASATAKEKIEAAGGSIQ